MPDNDPRFEVENAEMKETLRKMGLVISKSLPPGWGFGLFLFEFSGRSFFWISNADRKDMIKALREFIAREEAN